MTLLEDYVKAIRTKGGTGEIRACQSDGVAADGSLTVATTGTTIKPRNRRTRLFVTNNDTANFAKFKIGGAALTASSAVGGRLDSSGGFVELTRDTHGAAVEQALHLVADTASVSVYVYEEEAF